jgi:hypothetical protein
MNVIAFNFKVAWIDISILKRKFYFIATGKENMIAQ